MNTSKHANGMRRIGSMVGTEPRSEVIKVTPEMATAWLKLNTDGNRTVRAGKVDAYARDMAEGKWQLTHQSIAFNRTGELVDGQHRLQAVVRAGIPVSLLVSTGFAVEYNSPIDCGAGRSASDVLGLHNQLVAAIRGMRSLTKGITSSTGGRRGGWTLAELQETWDSEHEPLQWASDTVLGRSGVVGLRMSGWTASALAFAYPLNNDLVSSFAEALRTGEMLEREDPPYALRLWLGRERKVRSIEVALATCNALRYALQHDKVARIYTGETGYRWLCAQRRLKKIPNTPAPEDVPSYSNSETFEERVLRSSAKRAT